MNWAFLGCPHDWKYASWSLNQFWSECQSPQDRVEVLFRLRLTDTAILCLSVALDDTVAVLDQRLHALWEQPPLPRTLCLPGFLPHVLDGLIESLIQIEETQDADLETIEDLEETLHCKSLINQGRLHELRALRPEVGQVRSTVWRMREIVRNKHQAWYGIVAESRRVIDECQLFLAKGQTTQAWSDTFRQSTSISQLEGVLNAGSR